MDFMLGAAAAALLNIGLLGAIMVTYIQNLRLLKSYFTFGLVLVASLFIVQNIVIVIFWSNLYSAGPAIKSVVDSAAPYLFAINTAQSAGLAVLLWITRK
jgi:heme A synthase